MARAAHETVRAEQEAAASQLEEVKLLFGMVEERLQEAKLKLYEADQQVGAVDELVTSNGILQDPAPATQSFHENPILEAEIQKWGQGLVMYGEKTGELALSASSEQSFEHLSGVSPPASDVGALASGDTTLLHKNSNLQEVNKPGDGQTQEGFRGPKEL